MLLTPGGRDRDLTKERMRPMAKRKTGEQSLSRQRPDLPQSPRAEIDFETLIAAGIAAVVIKPARKRRRFKPDPKS